jgi:hypothetical protein
MNRLWGNKAYLISQIDHAKDYGITWREEITPFLNSLGVIVLNPCKKPTQEGNEVGDDQNILKKLQEVEAYDKLSEKMRQIRSIDLRMIDISDFVIVRLDMEIPACGSIEEITLANKQKKPVLIWCPQGRKRLYRWIYGMIPWTHTFDTLDELKQYLNYINSAEKIYETEKKINRWRFFDYPSLFNQIVPVQDLNKELLWYAKPKE